MKFLILFLLSTSVIIQPVMAQELVPYLSSPTDSSLWVSWKTGEGRESLVQYGTDSLNLDMSLYGNCQQLEDPDYPGDFLYHSAHLTGLQPSGKYYYKVTTGASESKIHPFVTQPAGGAQSGHYRFLVFGDHQDDEGRYPKLMQAAIDKVAEKFGGPVEDHINLIINDGDQVDKGTLWQWEHIHFKNSALLSPLLPVMTVVGNHDTYQEPGLEAYRALFFYDNLSYKGVDSPGGEDYYSFQVGRAVFVMTSTEHPEQDQVDWVRRIVDSVKVDDQVDWLFCVGHRPIQAEQFVGDISAFVRDRIIPILTETEKSALSIFGHHHLYARGQLRNAPMYHMVSGGATWDQYWGQAEAEQDFDDVQKTIDFWTYQIVEIDLAGKRMEVESYAIGSPMLGFTLDNVLVDSFHRQLGLPGPDQPLLATSLPDTVHLPFTFGSAPFQSRCGEVLNSTRFQISYDSSFVELAIDLLRDYENLYGTTGEPDYMPVDLHRDVNILNCTVKNYRLKNGRCYLRFRHRDQNAMWSEWSEKVSFVVKGSTEGIPELSVGGKYVSAADPIEVGYNHAPGNPKDWIGIYHEGDVPGSVSSTDWAYIEGSSGTLFLEVEERGGYFIAFFEDDGYEEICDRIEVDVIESIPVVTTSKTEFDRYESIAVHYDKAPSYHNDWIGIYRVNDRPGIVGYTNWEYVSGESGTVSFDPLPEGDYYVNYFMENGYEEPGERCYFSVSRTASSMPEERGENAPEALFKVFPSPTKGGFFVDPGFRNIAECEISVTTMTGELVCTWSKESIRERELLHLDLTGNAEGLYFVVITAKEATIARKIILL